MPDAEDATQPAWSPPYIAWRNLLNLLDRLEFDPPPRIDRAFLTGSNQARTQTMNALRSLGLITLEGGLTDRLLELVEAGADRPTVVRRILEDLYPEPVRLGHVKGTQKQLEEAFDAYGVSGDTRRKAIAFFRKAAAYAGIPVSGNLKSGSNRAPAPRRSRRSRTGEVGAPGGGPETGRREQPAPTMDALRARYIEMLMKRVDAQDEMDTALLNRIETLLGMRDGSDA